MRAAQPTNNDQFSIYQLHESENIYVAISKEHSETISNAISEYGSIRAVPTEYTVKGILVKKENNDFHIDESAPQKDITINELSVR